MVYSGPAVSYLQQCMLLVSTTHIKHIIHTQSRYRQHCEKISNDGYCNRCYSGVVSTSTWMCVAV